ncbi:MAG: STAS domain-containing protein [Leptospiraceae bacterium]|nr:STAS domain-containing protein [Leptospiraceae bacterium]
MELKLKVLEEIQIIEVHGKFDIECVEDFENLFQSQKKKKKSPSLAIDMNHLDYIDSSGIGSLIKSLNATKNAKGNLILFGLKPMIHNVFKLAKLDLFFQIMSNKDFQAKYHSDDDSDIDELLNKN